jgi:predicted dehydrogenase
MKKILIVGCGNIGGRHLQSLLDFQNIALDITVVEPNKITLNNAKSIFSTDDLHHNLTWVSNILDLTDSYDFTIVATQATNRIQLVNQLLAKGNSRFLIEKMVCQSISEYKKILECFKKYDAKGWVNTNFRYFSFYQKLIKYFSKNTPLKFLIVGGDKGLGSNAIHFLDLFLWFTHSDIISLNGDNLTEKLLPNKRSSGLVEFSGIITGKTNDSSISINFSHSFENSIIIEISNSEHHIRIDTDKSIITKIKGLDDFFDDFKFQHTSELTKKIINDVLQTDTCNLPMLDDLYLIHSELFRIFNLHIKKLTNKESDICPIT